MSPARRGYPSPHRFDVDLSPFDGVKVLGESVALLYSGLLRLKFGPPRDGLMEASATWPRHEGNALERAMERAERKIPGDRRTPGQRDCDRFMIVTERVFEAIEVVRAARAQQAFRR